MCNSKDLIIKFDDVVAWLPLPWEMVFRGLSIDWKSFELIHFTDSEEVIGG